METERTYVILVVDDAEDYLNTFRRRQSSPDRTIYYASRGEDAIELARSYRPDLALVDVDLIQECGLDLITPIQAASPGTTVILISGQCGVATMLSAFYAGSLLLPKSFDHAQIDGLLAWHRQPRKAAMGWPPKNTPLDDVELEYCERVHADCDGIATRAAERLRIGRGKLAKILKRRRK